MMRAGDLRHLLTVESPIYTTDSLGQRVQTWETSGQVYAAVKPVSAAEQDESGRTVHRTRYEIQARWNPCITSFCRLRFGEKVLTIISVVNVEERNRELRIQASYEG